MKHHQISRFFKPAKRKLEIPELAKKEERVVKKASTEIPGVETKPSMARSIAKKKLDVKSKLTPLESQILELKADNDDKLLAIQVGYKYKFYGDDAQIVSKLINIMLIPHEDSRFNYCSIPDNRLHVHLKRLLSYGYKVGVVKQLDLSSNQLIEGTKSLFSRALTGVYTLATYMNEEVEDGKNMVVDDHNGEYICCVKKVEAETGICFVRPITGEIIVDFFEDNDLNSELETRLTYYKPSECIIVSDNDDHIKVSLSKLISSINNTCRLEYSTSSKAIEELEDFLKDEPSIFEYYKLNFNPLLINCITELIKYLQPFNLASIFSITSNIIKFKNADYMILSSNVLKTLEIFENSTNNSTKGSLIWLLNHTRTKMGERLLYKWVSRPLINKQKIEDRRDALDDLTANFNHFIDCFMKLLSNDMDLEKLLIKLHYSLGKAKITRTEVYIMLSKFNDILKLIRGFEKDIETINRTFKSKALKSIFNELLELSKDMDIESNYLKMISHSYATSKDIKEQKSNYFNLKYHPWPEIVDQMNKIEEVGAQIEEETKNISNILGKSTKLVKNLNQEHLVEVRNTKINDLPLDWIRISATKTVTRFRSPKLQKLNNLILYNREQLDKACDEVFQKFLVSINDNYFKFHQIIVNLSIFDCLLSLAVTKAEGVKPSIQDENSIIRIKNFKNPIISSLKDYITNDIQISPEQNRISIITGPNMGGKSSYIKSAGILVIMNQIGCYLPCETAELSIFTDIFIRMGSFDNIIKGQSTFMIEMLEVLHILENYNEKSLILLDEIGRGTGTIDGYIIAYSILQYLATSDIKPVILFITHFHRLTDICKEYDDIDNFYMDFIDQNDEIVFLYKLVKGKLDDLYGLNVAKLAGIPDSVIKQAKLKAQELRREDTIDRVIKQIEQIKTNQLVELFSTID